MRTTLICLLLSSFLWSCQKDSFLEERGDSTVGDSTINVDATDEEIFDELDTQDPRASLDNRPQGLYRGVFSTFNGLYHGEIVINISNNGALVAAVHFTSDLKLAFTSESRSLNNFVFRNELGSFTFDVSDIDNPRATDVNLYGYNGYIKAYKEKSSRRISIALGHYDDSQDLEFRGNWDLISFGTREFNFPGALRLEETVISRGAQIYLDQDSANAEEFEGCFGFDVGGPYLAQVSGNISLLEGKNQFSVFNGFRCDWNLSYSYQNNRGSYSNSRCEPDAASGTWFWNSRSGRIYVDALRLNL